MITAHEWDLIQNLVDILEPFAEATDYLGGSSYCTYSIINPVIEEIKKRLKNSLGLPSPPLSPSSATEIDEDVFDYDDIEDESDQQHVNTPVNTSGLLDSVKKRLYEGLCQYWNFQDPRTLLATLLDPRTKSLEGVSVQIQLQTEELLRDKVEELKLNEILHDSSSSTPISMPNSTRKTKYKNSVFTKFHKSRPKVMDDELSPLRASCFLWRRQPLHQLEWLHLV
ncbi:unnamed protein product [Rhizophagus irregularis]|nr:unnamed protein product [Rhizophagus irregularis]